MSAIHFVGGEKGGVGKSMTSRLLAQYFIDTNTPFIGLDSDQSNSTFSRFYSEYAAPLIVDDYDSLDQLVVLAEESPEATLIVDLAAQTSARLGKWIDESDALGLLQDIGRRVYLWHVMDDGADAVYLLERLLARYPQPFVQIVVVSNQGRGECFNHFEASETYQKARERNAIFISLSKLQPQLAARIDFSNTSFWAAANNPDVMNLVERSRVRVWLKHNYAQFAQLSLQLPQQEAQ